MRRLLAALLLLGGLLLCLGYRTAVQMPVVRRLDLALTDWPAGAPPMRVVLLSDLHVVGPDSPPERIARLVAKVNALEPDLVLIAGDTRSYRAIATRRYALDEVVAPLRSIRAPLGTVAVLGNHDFINNGRTPMPAYLESAGITVLRNQAVRRGALTIAGAGDPHPGQFDPIKLDAEARARPGPTLVLSHTPDVIARLPMRYNILLAGHTHCGQIVIPFMEAPFTASFYGERYRCGWVRQGARRVLVTAGIGTSVLPLRLFAPPDLWVLTLGPLRK